MRADQKKKVIDVPIPRFLRKPWHWLIGQYLYVEDDFVQTVRKFGIFVFLVGSIAILLAMLGWQSFRFHTHNEASDLTLALAGIPVCGALLVTYLRLRSVNEVTDGMNLCIMLSTVWIWTFIHFCSMSYEPLFGDYAIIIVGMVFRTPYAKVFWAYMLLLSVQANYVSCFKHSTGGADFLPVVPGTRVVVGWEPFLMSLLTWIPGLLVQTAVWFAFKEQHRQVRAARKSVVLIQKVASLLHEYNTSKIAELVANAQEENDDGGDISVDLIESCEALVGNLERYRPFLPNYLFLARSVKIPSGGGSDIGGSLSDPLDICEKATVAAHFDNDDDDGEEEAMVAEDTPSKSLSANLRSSKFSSGVGTAGGQQAVISLAWVELQCNEWFSTALQEKRSYASYGRSKRYPRETLSVVTDAIFDLAQSTKASVHSLVGDTVAMTWNATHRIKQPELKACHFLLRLRQALLTAQPDLTLAGACCSGNAEIHSTTSIGTRQQATYIDAPWIPALEACYTLARRYKTLVVDANTEGGAHTEVAAQGVDCIRYVPQVALIPLTGEPAVRVPPAIEAIPDFRPGGFPASAPDVYDTLLGIQGPQQEEAAKTFLEPKPQQFTIAFELIDRKKESINPNDDDQEAWLYQQASPEKKGMGKKGDPEAIVTAALMKLLDGRGGDAAVSLVESGVVSVNVLLGLPGAGGKQASDNNINNSGNADNNQEILESRGVGEDTLALPLPSPKPRDLINSAVVASAPETHTHTVYKSKLPARLAAFCHHESMKSRNKSSSSQKKERKTFRLDM